MTGKVILSEVAKFLGSITAVCAALWFFGEPFLEDYVDKRIESNQVKVDAANTSKVKLRQLHSREMGIPVDRVHIREGEMHSQYLMLKGVIPTIEDYFSKNIPYMYIRLDGKEIYVRDGEHYEIHRNESGEAYHFRNGKMRPLP